MQAAWQLDCSPLFRRFVGLGMDDAERQFFAEE